MNSKQINIFWFRRDLRLEDNHALYQALKSGEKVLPIFIFDTEILNNLPKNDHRVNFIYNTLFELNHKLSQIGTGIQIFKGNPIEIWQQLIEKYTIKDVFFNRDYEPYALKRDEKIYLFLKSENISTHSFKDQVIFEKSEILKSDATPYTIYTPYKKQWIQKFSAIELPNHESEFVLDNLLKTTITFPSKKELGINDTSIEVPKIDLTSIKKYDSTRDFPALNTTKVGLFLRFGTLSIRTLIRSSNNETYLSELIWREFFMQIIFHFPRCVTQSFKQKYDAIQWENDENKFEKWRNGQTGYPLVDAGMRELIQTGFMHNRVRMVCASFLCKHLLIDWRWGEAYFAEKLFDFDLSANNGNWQWAAGTGCDAAPYFRIFNPETQFKKFDSEATYVQQWVPEYKTKSYLKPIVNHEFAREKALNTYKEGLNHGN